MKVSYFVDKFLHHIIYQYNAKIPYHHFIPSCYTIQSYHNLPYIYTPPACPYPTIIPILILDPDNRPPSTPIPGIGAPCPTGSYCPRGSPAPIACPSGTYTDTTGRASCITCPSGYVCPTNTSVSTSILCPRGYYCQLGRSA